MSEIIEPLMDHAEAERITERIRLTVDTTARNLSKLAELVSEAYERRADLAMGYGSWAEYSKAEFGDETQKLVPEFRRQLVGMLSAEGMSTRAIAPAVGVSEATAWRDTQALHHEAPASEPDLPGTGATVLDTGTLCHATSGQAREFLDSIQSAPSAATPEAAPEPAPVRKVTGLDGKQYSAPKPQQESKPRQHPLPDQFFRARYDMSRKVESLERLAGDQRFATNKEKVAQENLNDLNHAIEALQRIVASLQN